MAKTERGASRTVYVLSEPSNRLTAWDVRDFVKALDAAGVPDNAQIEDHHDHSTRHLQRLSVRFTEKIDGWPQEEQ